MNSPNSAPTRAKVAQQIRETLAEIESEIKVEEAGEREVYKMFMPKMAADQLGALEKVLHAAGRDLVYWEIHPRPEENSIRFNVYAVAGE
ncbi:MAG: hypothetical protein R3272_01310 [Candidatus Promineifilaceae bacterium]|nr:hypothetical protein [Candidatus Promineifilaceae bacterium]